VFGLAFAGVWLLAGPGWALVAGAVLVLVLWRREPDWRAVAARARAQALGVWSRVAARPRRAAAAGGMAAGVALVPSGFGLAVTPGVALIAAGGVLCGVAVLLGWGA
jgi:hypothetical protein